MMKNEIILQAMSKQELKDMIQGLMQSEFQNINKEIQMVIGDDDLISTGAACRILGVCSKVLKVLVDQGHFTVFWHLKERRYKRGELLDYRNSFRANKLRN